MNNDVLKTKNNSFTFIIQLLIIIMLENTIRYLILFYVTHKLN